MSLFVSFDGDRNSKWAIVDKKKFQVDKYTKERNGIAFFIPSWLNLPQSMINDLWKGNKII